MNESAKPTTIHVECIPDVISATDVVKKSGRSRSYINKMISLGKLDHGYVFEKKVVVKNDKYYAFLKVCGSLDAAYGQGFMEKPTGKSKEE